MRRAGLASGGGAAARTVRRPAPARLRPFHLPFSLWACCSIFSAACRIDAGQALPSPVPRIVWSPRAWMMISVRCRYFSFVRMTCAERAASFRTRPSRASLRSMSCLIGAVTSKCRPVISSRMMGASEQDFSLVGRRDLQLFAVFGDGPPREHQSLFLEDADDLRIAERFPRIFILDDLADALLDGDRRHAVAVRTADAAVEEELQLEHALRDRKSVV